MPAADIGESFRSFFDAVDSFFSNLASVGLVPLLISLACFTAYLTLRARASFNILRAAYPSERIQFREIWGSYFAGYGFNAVIPARGGDVVRLFLTKTSVPHSSYPAVAASFIVELGFDVAMGSLILIFSFTQGVFPKPPDFADLNAFDLSYLAQHPRFTLFLLSALAVGQLVDELAVVADPLARFLVGRSRSARVLDPDAVRAVVRAGADRVSGSVDAAGADPELSRLGQHAGHLADGG